MATSDEASEWGTAVLVRSGSDQPFDVTALGGMAEPAPEGRYESLYAAAQSSLASATPQSALPILEQLAAERPDYADVTMLLERVKGDQRVEDPATPEAHPATPDVRPATLDVRPATPEVIHRLADLPPPPPPPPPRPTPTPGRGLKWAVVILGVLLAATIAFIALAVSLADDPEPTPPSVPASLKASPDASPDPSSIDSGASGPADPVIAACGPSAAVPDLARSLVVACSPTTPVIDGSFAEWDTIAPITVDAVVFPRDGANPGDVRGEARAVWDRDGLYVHATVVDPNIRDVNESQPDQFWRGDALSFEFGPDAQRLGRDAGVRNGRDRHVIVGISAGQALASMNLAAGGDFPAGTGVPEIEARMALTDDGYQIEARVPWSVLGVSDPSRGQVFAGNFNISDAKLDQDKWDLGTMISSNPDRVLQRRPAIWQPIVLGDPS
jgi:hypothetical protein